MRVVGIILPCCLTIPLHTDRTDSFGRDRKATRGGLTGSLYAALLSREIIQKHATKREGVLNAKSTFRTDV
jgi:hypothetical protein